MQALIPVIALVDVPHLNRSSSSSGSITEKKLLPSSFFNMPNSLILPPLIKRLPSQSVCLSV